jgi:outer membrane protein insertion porin family
LQRLQDTAYTQRKIDLKGDILLSDRFTLGFSGGMDRVIPPDDTTKILMATDSRILYTGAEIRYDSRENIYIPQSGIVYRAIYTYGNKNIYARPNSPPGISDQIFSLQRYSMDLEVYFSFFKRQSTMVKMFIGQVTSDKLEDNDFYKVGGMKNIRGYREDQFRASKFTYGTIEFRYAFARKSFAHAFFDPGYYYRDADPINRIDKQEGFLYGYGIGIRLETALGIVGVSYGLGKGDSFLDGKIHFGLINEF